MPTDTVPVPTVTDWSSLTPLGVCLGLFSVLVLVGIPWLIREHRKDMAEARKEFLDSLAKEEEFRNALSERYESERKRMAEQASAERAQCSAERNQQWERYEANTREIMQAVRPPRGGR